MTCYLLPRVVTAVADAPYSAPATAVAWNFCLLQLPLDQETVSLLKFGLESMTSNLTLSTLSLYAIALLPNHSGITGMSSTTRSSAAWYFEMPSSSVGAASPSATSLSNSGLV